MTPGTLAKNLKRWQDAQSSVEEVVRTLAHVERHAIEEVALARRLVKAGRFDDEQVRNVEKEQSHQVRVYLEIVQHAISIRNKVEAELFFSKAAPAPPKTSQAGCKPEG